MKSLSNYTNEAQTKLFEERGIFFAFSNEQVAEQAIKGVAYSSLGAGMCCPTANCAGVHKELVNIQKDAIKRYKEDYSQEEIILYELLNHEAYYTYEIEDTLDSLEGFGYTKEEVLKVFNANKEKYEFSY